MFSMKLTTMAAAALFVFGCLISSATAQGSGRSLLERLGRLGVLTKGKCPVTTTQDNFDSARYLGKWYELERFNNWFEIGVICGSAEYGANPDSSISVTNGGLRRFSIFGRPFDFPTSITGEATTPDANKPAQLKVKFSDFDTSTDANYFIVETDYDNVAVVFSCSEFNIFGNYYNLQFAWILTRQAGVTPANMDAILAKLTSFGIDVTNFKTVDQSNCPA